MPSFEEPMPLRRASRSFRLAAIALDLLLYLAISTPCTGVTMLAVVYFAAPVDWLNISQAAGLIIYAAVQCVLVVRTGQSLGKRLLGLRIVRPHGVLPGFVRGVLMRSWVFAIPVMGYTMLAPHIMFAMMPIDGPSLLTMYVVLYMGYGLAAIDPAFILGPSRRCVHDWLADTEVVHAAAWRPS